MARKVENEMKQAQGLEFWILSNFLDMDVLTFLYPSKHATLNLMAYVTSRGLVLLRIYKSWKHYKIP